MQTKSNVATRHNKSFFIKILAGLMAFVAIIVCGINITKAIEHNLITVEGTAGDIEVKGNNIENLTITPTLIFNKTGDSITYQMTLQSTDNSPFQINNISDDNTNTFITTSYQYDKTLNSNKKPILITLSYTSYIPLGEELNLNDIHITIDVNEKSDSKDNSDQDNPDHHASDTDGSSSQNSTPNNSGSNNSDSHTNSNKTNIAIPNTGTPSRKTVEVSGINNNNISSSIIIGVVAIATILTVIPSPKKHRVTFHIISFVALSSIISWWTTTNTFAEPSQLKITIVGGNISATPNSQNPENVVSVVFPNIYNTPEIKEERNNQTTKPAPGNAIILKTLDDKYVLMDTGPKLVSIQNAIYDKLKELQSSDIVTIDYLIISHLDSDHRGNAVAFMHHSEKFNIKNIIFKHEITEGDLQEAAFRAIADEAATQNIHIITSNDSTTANYLTSIGVTNYGFLSEGMTISVGKYLNLDIFNTANVFEGKPCPRGERIDWTANMSSDSLYTTENGEYVYIDGSDYQFRDNAFGINSAKYPYSDVTFRTTTRPVSKEGGSNMNRYFYATESEAVNFCQSNPNSFGILAEIVTTNQKRYMYFSGDIENAGYSTLSSGANSAQLYSSRAFENGDFVNNITPYAIPSEDNTATAIYNKLAADAISQNLSTNDLLNNIVLYQMSHHGGNNSEKAIWKLNLNRGSGIYAIQDGSSDMTNSTSFRLTKAYYYTLGNVPDENKINVFARSTDIKKDGVTCNVNSIGATTCERY